MNKVYLYDEEGNYTGYKEVFPNYQPQQWETLVKPDLTLYKNKFDGTAWHGLTMEQFQAQNKPKPQPTSPSKTDILIANLTKTIAKMGVMQNQKIVGLENTINNLKNKIE